MTAVYLDTRSWVRRSTFEFFRDFDKPYFNACVRLDVAPLLALAAARKCEGRPFSLMLAYHHLALVLMNANEPFRYRLEGGRVRVHERVHGSTTVLREDGSIGFAPLHSADDFASFVAGAGPELAAAQRGGQPLDPGPAGDTAVVHFTTLPWLHFTSFSHARNWKREDSVPKIAFGRIDADGRRRWLPFAVEVHHALMDGLHVGRLVQAFEAALLEPQRWID